MSGEPWYGSNEGGLYCHACYLKIDEDDRQTWKIHPLQEPDDRFGEKACWDCQKPYTT